VKVKFIRQVIADFVRDARRAPQTVFAAVRWYRERNLRTRAEAERLDRLRNPSKYLGK